MLVALFGATIIARPRTFRVAAASMAVLAAAMLLLVNASIRLVIASLRAVPAPPQPAKDQCREPEQLTRAADVMIVVGLVGMCVGLAMTVGPLGFGATLVCAAGIFAGLFVAPVVQIAALEKVTRVLVDGVTR